MVYDVQVDYESLRAALNRAIKTLRLSFIYRADDQISGECLFELSDTGTRIEVLKRGDKTRLVFSPDCSWEIEHSLTSLIESDGIPFNRRRDVLTLGTKNDSGNRVQKGKPGRPSYPEDLLALEKLRSGVDPKQVKRDWHASLSRELVDEERQFKKLVERASA